MCLDKPKRGFFIFFMISGYVILMTVERTGDLGTFAAARFSRLYPAFLVAVLFTTAVTDAAGFNPTPLTQADVYGNFVMVTFLLGIPAVDTSYWTLSYEVVFYVTISVTVLGFRVRKPELVCLAWLSPLLRFVLHMQLPSASHPGSRLAVLTASDYAQFFSRGNVPNHQFAGYCLIDALERRGTNPNLAVVAAGAVAIGTATVMCYTIERPGQRLLTRFFLRQPRAPYGLPP